MSDQVVQVTAYAKVDAVQGWPNRHSGVPVLVRVTAPEMGADRAGVDLVAVLDVSRSALVNRQDMLEEAMKVVVEKLKDKDRLAIVPIQTSPAETPAVLTEMSFDGRTKAFEKLRSLAVSGDKKLSMALAEARKVLEDRPPEQERRIGFIVLISDGDDTSIFQPENMKNVKQSVHAFGFRDTHNVEAMHHIAEHCTGTYAILNDEHDRITDAFEASITKITAVVAVEAEVTVTCSHPRAALSAIEVGRFTSGVNDRKTGYIKASALEAGAVRSFVVYVDGLRDDEHDDLPKSLGVHAKYRHASSMAEHEVDGQVLVVRKGGAIDEGSKEVAAEIVRIEAVNIVHDIIWKYRNRALVDQAADELRQRWMQLRDSEYGREAPDLISGLASEMQEMEASMRRCTGLSYMHSWHTRHMLQQQHHHQTGRRHAAAVLSSAKKGECSVGQQAPPPPPQMSLSKDTSFLAAGGAVDHGGGHKKRNYLQHQQQYDEMEMIEQRLAYWAKVKCELPSMALHDGAAGECPDQTTMVFREASRESIDRAMFHDVYLAVVHATDRRNREMLLRFRVHGEVAVCVNLLSKALMINKRSANANYSHVQQGQKNTRRKGTQVGFSSLRT